MPTAVWGHCVKFLVYRRRHVPDSDSQKVSQRPGGRLWPAGSSKSGNLPHAARYGVSTTWSLGRVGNLLF